MLRSSIQAQGGATIAVKLKRVDKGEVISKAWTLAVIRDERFTAMVLAVFCQMPCNRHFRNILNGLVKSGHLVVKQELDDDGHYRRYFQSDACWNLKQKGKAK